MPPEVIHGEEHVDARSDLYALGCVGYWLLSGALVFEARSTLEMIMNHAQSTPPPLAGRVKTPVPPALEAVILSCLEKDPARRPESAQELARRLAACGVAPWTDDDARRWWDEHRPAPAPAPAPRPAPLVAAAVGLLAALGLAAALEMVAPRTALAAPPAPRTTRVGFVLDGAWDRNAEILGLVQGELRELAGPEHPLEFPAAATLEADWTPGGVTSALQRLLNDDRVDLVVALGVLASDRGCKMGALPKPLVAPAVVDPRIQGIARKEGASGVHNLAYLTVPSAIERDMGAFHELVPFQRLTILLNQFVAAEMPDLARSAREAAADPGVTVTVVPVRGSAAAALAAVPADAQAVYVMPILQMSTAAMDSLIRGLNARALPTFSALGETEVARGMLAGVSPDIFPPLARRLAVVVQRILAGEEPGGISTAFSVGQHLTLNMATARAIRFQPTWADMAEATLVGDERAARGRALTLNGVLREAQTVNLDLAAAERAVAAGAQSVKSARAGLLPQADATTTGLLIDSDRAGASFGAQPERSVTSALSLTQVVYSEPALARLAIEKANQRGREGERDQTRLDIVRAAGGAYLQVLRALTLERIRQENLRLTREHLELARLRESVGSSRLSDVYRWESELATNRKAAIEANTARNLAELELNRLLHRPAEEPFRPADLGLDAPDVAVFLDLCAPYFADRLSLRRLRGFLVAEAERQTPEIARLDAGLAAARRSYTSASRALYQPSLALAGSVSRLMAEGGAGSGTPVLDGLPAGTLPTSDDVDWSVALKLSFPVFHGGDKRATRARAREDVAKLELQRQAAVERVDERTRAAVHNAGASFAGIREAQSAAEWARKNLDLVSEAYARGAVSFIDLLDAQNAHIVADQGAADAVYGFLDDLLEVQRAIGKFGYAMSPEERGDFSRRLRLFAEQAGASTEEE